MILLLNYTEIYLEISKLKNTDKLIKNSPRFNQNYEYLDVSP